MRRVWLLMLAVSALSGCHKQEIANGSHFNLDSIPDQRLEAPTVTVTDARPAWERRTYSGTFTLIPLENLHPSPLQHLQHIFREETAGLSEPPSDVQLVLQSFRVVANSEAPRPNIDGLAWPTGPIDFGPSGSPGGAAFAVAFYVTIVLVAETAVISYEAGKLVAYDLRHAHDRPKELRDAYDPGLTCDIRATAALQWRDGKRREIDLRAVVHGSGIAADAGWQNELRAAVQGACTQLALECKDRILHPEAANSPVRKLIVPAYTAYSGN
jgi:hypothetical protein